jgi:hypothetical protein
MKSMSNFIYFVTKPIILLHLILLIQWAIFLGLTIQPYTLNVPDHTYVPLRGHLTYTSLIRQSRDGAWKTITTHTTRPTPELYVHTFFIFLGKIAAIFNIDPPMMYMASRMAAAVILFWCTYFFVTTLLPKTLHAPALFFILALEPGPMLSHIGWNPELWRPSIFSYYPQIVSLRHFGLPHHTLGEALGLLTITLLFLTINRPSVSRFLWLAIATLLGVNVLPPYFIIISICVLLPWCLWSLIQKVLPKTVVPMAVTVGIIAVVSLFLKQQMSQGYPAKDFNIDEKRWVTNFDVLISYLSTLILYIPFIALVWARLLWVWKKMNANTKFLIYIMSAWILIPPLLVPLTSYPWFPLANFRLMDGYNYAPAGILAAIGFVMIGSLFKRKSISQFIAGFSMTATIIGTGFLSWHYTNIILTEQSYPWTNVYIANDHYKAFKFLETVPNMSGVMITNHFGEIATEYAPVRAYIGSTPGFVDWDERFWVLGKFYSQSFTTLEAKELLKRENITYVYYGDAEKGINSKGTPLYPDLLVSVFESPVVSIYKVK